MPTFNASARVLIWRRRATVLARTLEIEKMQCGGHSTNNQARPRRVWDIASIFEKWNHAWILKRVPTPLLLGYIAGQLPSAGLELIFWVPRMKVLQGDKDNNFLTRVTVYKTMPWVQMSGLACRVLFSSQNTCCFI